MDLDLADRVYIVTGGTRGLGRATADVLVAEGARVVVSGRSRESLDSLATAYGEAAVTVAADNADADTPGRLMAAARGRWGRLDGALISVGGPPAGQVSAIEDEQWRAAFESVFLGGVRLCREIGAALGEGGSLALVLSSSVRQPSSPKTSRSTSSVTAAIAAGRAPKSSSSSGTPKCTTSPVASRRG